MKQVHEKKWAMRFLVLYGLGSIWELVKKWQDRRNERMEEAWRQTQHCHPISIFSLSIGNKWWRIQTCIFGKEHFPCFYNVPFSVRVVSKLHLIFPWFIALPNAMWFFFYKECHVVFFDKECHVVHYQKVEWVRLLSRVPISFIWDFRAETFRRYRDSCLKTKIQKDVCFSTIPCMLEKLCNDRGINK